MKHINLKNVPLQIMIASVLFGVVACRNDDDEVPSTQEDMASVDQGEDDMGADMQEDLTESPDADPDMEADEGMACEPLTECAAGVCGMVADGCGGMLDCGACECEAGVPSSPYCGTCGLGTSSCEGVDSGPASCDLDDDTISLDGALCATVRFVSLTAIMQGDGSRERPYQPEALQEAIDDIGDAGGGLLVLEAGDYVLPEQLKLREGVHVLGGATSDFLFDEQGKSTLRITPTGSDQELIGVSALDLASKTWLKQLEIVLDDVEEGNDVYAMHVMNSPGLHLEEIEIYGGKIAKGSDGKAGMPGADGLSGGDAEDRVTLAKRVGDMTQNGYVNGAFAGTAGVNGSCPSRANGGAGGEGFHIVAADAPPPELVVYTVVPAESGGSNQVGLAGGDSGSESDPNGKDGLSGSSGMRGFDGAPGESQGTLVRGFWDANTSGQDGEDGQDGTGGAGGGGSYWMELRSQPQESKPGSSGGGGGAGGCGGTGGGAGLGGGTGFGILLVDSSGVILDRVAVQGPDAGDGGNGSEGGRGGEGANGGVGSTTYAITATTSNTTPHTRAAGRGGTGGQGGDGGHGGGGAGGSAFGVYCANTTVERIEPVQVSAGAAGMGGLGLSQASSGEQVDVFGCW